MSILGAIGTGVGIVGGLKNIFGIGQKAKEKRQWEYEQKAMGLQHQYNMQAAEQAQKYAIEMNDRNFQQQNLMNEKNFEQQKEMFDYQSEYMSPEQMKKRLQEAGMNPALAYGGMGLNQAGGTSSGGSTGGGGGTGATVQGVSNPGSNAIGMGLQAKAIDAQANLANAQAIKAGAEATKISGADTEKTKAETKTITVNADMIEESTKLVKEQQITEQNKRELNDAEKGYKEAITELQEYTKRLTESKTAESWYNARGIEMMTYKASKEAEKLIQDVEGMKIDNEIKARVKENVIKQQEENLKSTIVSIAETQSRTKLNSTQQKLVTTKISDLLNDMRIKGGAHELNRMKVQNEIAALWEQIGISNRDMDVKENRLTLDIIMSAIGQIRDLQNK